MHRDIKPENLLYTNPSKDAILKAQTRTTAPRNATQRQRQRQPPRLWPRLRQRQRLTAVYSANSQVADFGLSRVKTTPELTTEVVGTPSYIAPEVINQQPYTEAVCLGGGCGTSRAAAHITRPSHVQQFPAAVSAFGHLAALSLPSARGFRSLAALAPLSRCPELMAPTRICAAFDTY